MDYLEISKDYSRVNDDIEKERYLREVENSLHKYIRGGVKNKQLDELVKVQVDFQKKYEQMFELQDLLENITEELFKINQDEVKKLWIKVEYKDNEEQMLNKILQEELNKNKQKIQENMQNKLKKITKDIAYLSHMNALYDLYEKEESMRRKEREYEKTSEKYKQLIGIMKNIQDNKRMSFEAIKKESISKVDLDNLLMKNKKYFNIRNSKKGIQISISPAGKKYIDYIEKSKQFYSQKTFNDQLYKNCNNIMESFENSLDKNISFEPKFEGVSKNYQRLLKKKQRKICAKIISRTEFSYNTKYMRKTQETYNLQQNKKLPEIVIFNKKEEKYRNEKIGFEIL